MVQSLCMIKSEKDIFQFAVGSIESVKSEVKEVKTRLPEQSE